MTDRALPQFPSHPTCTLCPLHLAARSVGVPSIVHHSCLASGAAVVFLGQNPGLEEDQQNLPFVGRSGRMVRSSFAAPLLSAAPCPIYFSNICRCYTPTASPPTRKQYVTCRPYFLADLAVILPLHPLTIVVCLGAPASTHLYESCGIPRLPFKKARSQPNFTLFHPTTSLPFSVFCTYHPAAILRTPSLAHPVAEHLNLVADRLLSRLPLPSRPTFVPPSGP